MHTQANKTMHDSGLHFAPGWKECSDKDGRTKKKSFSITVYLMSFMINEIYIIIIYPLSENIRCILRVIYRICSKYIHGPVYHEVKRTDSRNCLYEALGKYFNSFFVSVLLICETDQ